MPSLIRFFNLLLITIFIGLAASPVLAAKKKKTTPNFAFILPGDEQVLVIDKKNGTMAVLSIPNLQVQTMLTGKKPPRIIEAHASPDNEWLLVAFKGGAYEVWDLKAVERKFSGEAKISTFFPLNYLFVPERQLLIVDDPGAKQLIIWNLLEGAKMGTPIESRSAYGEAMFLTADGEYLVYTGRISIDKESYDLGVFSFPGGDLIGRTTIKILVPPREDAAGMSTYSTYAYKLTPENTLSLIIRYAEIGDRAYEIGHVAHGMTLSLPDLDIIEDTVLEDDSRPVVILGQDDHIKMLDSNVRIQVTTDKGLGLSALELDENQTSVGSKWDVLTRKGGITQITCWDVSSSGKWIVIGNKKDRQIHLLNAENLAAQTWTTFGITVDWMEPSEITSVTMP